MEINGLNNNRRQCVTKNAKWPKEYNRRLIIRSVAFFIHSMCCMTYTVPTFVIGPSATNANAFSVCLIIPSVVRTMTEN